LRGGAAGYLLKNIEGDALISAIQRVMVGESVIANEMTSKLFSAYRGATENAAQPVPKASTAASTLGSLSPRENDILRAIAQGASNKEIGRQFGIAETTVKIHVQHILRKLDVSTRVHAAVIATENGLT
jgi:two-component system nitrate/nitrite response regulator NarL